jgi:ATP-binding cassette, subfamily B, bacterial
MQSQPLTQPLTTFQSLRRSLGMVVQAAPMDLRNLALLNLFTRVGPAVSLFLSKIVIDEASRLMGQVSQNPIALIGAQPKLMWCIIATLVLNLAVDAIDSVSTALLASLRDRVQGYVQGQVWHKVANFNDIALFETPELLNLVELTSKGVQRLQRLSMIMAATLVGIFILIPSVLLSWSIAWWVPLLLLVSSAPSILVEMKHHRKSWRMEENQASAIREMNIYSKLLIGEAYAKEVRLFSLQPILLDRWHGLFRNLFNKMQRIRREGAIAVMLWALIGGIGAALPYVYVVLGVLQGSYTLGDLALYTGIILQLRQSLYQPDFPTARSSAVSA